MIPMTPGESTLATERFTADIGRHGWWEKNCAECSYPIGGRLASYGKPTEADLQYAACPNCGAVGRVKLAFVPPVQDVPILGG
jgi:hypothetical protein